MAGTQISDSQISGSAKAASSQSDHASAKLSQEANSGQKLGGSGVLGDLSRFVLTTGDGILHLPEGVGNAIVADINHPINIVKAVGGSMVIGGVLKAVLPEAGPVGAIAGAAMGAWFVGQSLPGFVGAYDKGLNARSWSDMNAAGAQWGDAAGQLGVNSALGVAGYKIGAGVTGEVLSGARFDNFADAKQNFWNGAADTAKNALPKPLQNLFHIDASVPTAASVGLQPHYAFDGETARLMDSVKAAPKGEPTGPVDNPDAPMNVTVMMQSKASALRMDRYIRRMSQGKASALTDEGGAFEKQFGAAPESLAQVQKFAADNGLNVDNYDMRSGQVNLSGKTSDFQKAFKVDLQNYQTEQGIVQTHAQPLSVPSELAPHVRSVLGLDTREVASVPARIQYKIDESTGQLLDKNGQPVEVRVQYAPPSQAESPSSMSLIKSAGDRIGRLLGRPVNAAETTSATAEGPGGSPVGDSGPGSGSGQAARFRGYFATDVARAQNFPMSSGGEGQNGAFISLGGGIDQADYAKFYAQHSDVVPQPKPLKIITIDGAKNDFGDPNGADGENSLDAIQMQSVAPRANVSMVLGQNSDQSFNNVFVRAIFPQQGEAQNSVVSSSWGAAESNQSPQSIKGMSMTFKQAAIRGVQVFSASGDTGARDGASSYQVDYPASDPNVTGVGGLKMVLNPQENVISASAWNEGQDSSTGGGVSKVFSEPAWQNNANVPKNLDTGKPGRGVPDISTNADPATGFRVRVDGGEYVIGGTSDAAPLYSGMMLNINSELVSSGIKPVSPLNPWLYARGNSSIFHDVTQGGNNGYSTARGWDPVTGWGYLDGQQALDAMKANQTANLGGGSGPISRMTANFRGVNQPQNNQEKQIGG